MIFSYIKKILKITAIFALLFLFFGIILFQVFSYRIKPEKIKYGVSFNVPYALELGLDWQQAYISILEELGVKRIRLGAHWPLVEPEKDSYDFTYLDFQLNEARERKVDVILAIGRRVPRWPECHVPDWAQDFTEDQQQAEIREYLKLIVERYKDYDNLIYWQIENEPFLEMFAYEHCGDLDVEFLEEEISIVKNLNPERKILITDSGNMGGWKDAYSRGDLFGTSVYVYFWNPFIGKFRSILPPSFYSLKDNYMEFLYGHKKTILIELSLEPWLIQPIVKAPLKDQFDMMDLERMKKILKYGENTRYEEQYLWGAEWWYWLKVKHGMPEIWNFTKQLFK